MLSLPASKPQSPHKGSLGISLREDRTETRLMLSLPAAKPHSPHKRSLGIILREEKARLMLSLPVCKSRSPPERLHSELNKWSLGLGWVKTTQKHVRCFHFQFVSLGAHQQGLWFDSRASAGARTWPGMVRQGDSSHHNR